MCVLLLLVFAGGGAVSGAVITAGASWDPAALLSMGRRVVELLQGEVSEVRSCGGGGTGRGRGVTDIVPEISIVF